MQFHLLGTIKELEIRLLNVTAYLDWNNDLGKHDLNTHHELFLESDTDNDSISFTPNDLISKNSLRIGRKDNVQYDAKIRYYLKNSNDIMECDIINKLDISVISCDENDPISPIVAIDKLCDSFIDCKGTENDESPERCKGENEFYTASVWTSTSVIILLGFLCVKLIKSISKPVPIWTTKQACRTGIDATTAKSIKRKILAVCEDQGSITKDKKLRKDTARIIIQCYSPCKHTHHNRNILLYVYTLSLCEKYAKTC